MRVNSYYLGSVSLALLISLGNVFAQEPVATPTAVPYVTQPAFESVHGMAPSIDWVTSYNRARKAGTKSERPVMLFVTMEQCRFCTRMQNEAFAPHQNELNESFVPAKLYLDPKSELGKSLKITIFPTTMFIAPDGKILGYIRGYVPREEFAVEMQAAKTANDEQVELARAKKETIEK